MSFTLCLSADLDLMVVTPNGAVIFEEGVTVGGGTKDADLTGEDAFPVVEAIFFPAGAWTPGRYLLRVVNRTNRKVRPSGVCDDLRPVPFQLTGEIGDAAPVQVTPTSYFDPVVGIRYSNFDDFDATLEDQFYEFIV